jgi:hypothetical protein
MKLCAHDALYPKCDPKASLEKAPDSILKEQFVLVELPMISYTHLVRVFVRHHTVARFNAARERGPGHVN